MDVQIINFVMTSNAPPFNMSHDKPWSSAMHRRFLLAPLVLGTLGSPAQQTSVLFIGNSYTYANDLPNTFRQLALSLGDTAVVSSSAPGGFTFEEHADHAPTLGAIASQPWDFVVLQEQSQLPAFNDVEATMAYAKTLCHLIEANDECTWPVFYMTWGRENGDALNCDVWPPVCTYEGMQALLRERYLEMAEYNDAYAAPVGVAWKYARDTHPFIDLYQPDESHPTSEGTYLAACVFYSTLFHASSVGATFNSTLHPDTAAILRGIASALVLDSTATWNMDVPSGTSAQFTGTSSEAPNDVTFHHPGQGMHWWACSNGQNSTEASPTFVVDEPGFYTFTHIYHDPCGNSDTLSWTFEFYDVGVPELGVSESYHVRPASPNAVEVSGGTGAEIFRLMDLNGRTLLTQKLGTDRVRIVCPVGLHVWWITAADGTTRAGKILVI